MSDLILRQEDIDRFTKSLNKMVAEAEVDVAVLIHRDGHLLATAGKTELIDTTALSALVSASFSSMIAVANLVGEREFTTQHLAGEDKGIYIALVDEYTFSVSVFGVELSLEPLQAVIDKTRKPLSKALGILYNNEPEPFGDDEYEEEELSVPGADEATPEEPAEEEVLDAEEVARRTKGDGAAAGKAVPRKLSYTGTGKSTYLEKEKQKDEDKAADRRKIREPDADDADLEALANAITSRKEREVPKSKPKADDKKEPDGSDDDKDGMLVVDGERMNVVSLKDKRKGKKKKKG
jgi:hypothetical protein